MFGYIYLTYNKINNKIYIGQHKRKYDENYLRSGKLIRRAIEKYGRNNFSNHLIEYCSSFEELCNKEIYWINKYQSFSKNEGYNLLKGGQFGDITYGMSEKEYKEYCKKSQGKNNGMYKSGERGIHPKGMLGKTHSEEYKIRLSKMMKGEGNPCQKGFWSENGRKHPRGVLGKNHNNTQFKHQISVKVIYNNKEYEFSNLTKASRELNIPRNILQSPLHKKKPYKNPQNFPQYSIYNGIVVKNIDNTEVTYEDKIS